jgi:acyl-CoA thioesterase
MKMTFTIASEISSITDHVFRAAIPDGWQQGRGAFGGLVLGILARACERDEPDSRRRIRSLMGDIAGPVAPGECTVRVRTLRRGNNQSNLAAELVQGESVLATASAILSPPRTAHSHAGFLGAPATGDWSAIEPARISGAAAFAQHYLYRDAGSTAQSIEGFISETEPLERIDSAAINARLDAWYPTLFQLEGPRPCATVGFAAELLVDPATLPADPLRYRARLAAMNEGFFVEMRELWQGDRVVALNQQTFAILK